MYEKTTTERGYQVRDVVALMEGSEKETFEWDDVLDCLLENGSPAAVNPMNEVCVQTEVLVESHIEESSEQLMPESPSL